MTELYTSSRLKVLRSCLRQHYYRYVLGIQQPSNTNAHFGTVGHLALEAWYLAWKRGDVDARLPEALAAIDQSDIGMDDRVRLRAIITAYHLRWCNEPWEVIDVEIEFRYVLGGYTIGGKIDALIRDTRDGRVWCVEHKTTGMDASAGSTYWDKLAIDTQVSIYIDGATVLGHDVAGCVYDVLQRPRHEIRMATPEAEREYTAGKGCKRCGGSAKSGAVEQGKGFYDVVFASEVKRVDCDECAGTGWKKDKDGKPEEPRLYARMRSTDETADEFMERVVAEISERPDEFLIRGVVVRLEDELPKMRQDLVDAIRLERTSALFEMWPRNSDSCSRYGSMCSYFPICSSRADVDDETRFPRGQAHPELASGT